MQSLGCWFLKKQLTWVRLEGYNSRFTEAMTMTFCEKKLEWIWRNFGLDHLL
jgi:hypothetical protein